MTVIESLLNVFKIAADKDERRDILLDTPRGKHLYHDGNECYAPLIPEYSRKLSNVESLAGAVVEEAKRRNNENGQFMTVIFTEAGGVFYPDDVSRLDKWTFDRCLSQQWVHATKVLGQPMSHKQFLRWMQGLRPSLGPSYASLMRDFRKVTFDHSNKVESQPILENGSAGLQVAMTLTTKSGDQDIYMPGGFDLICQFAKAGEKSYVLPIELDVSLADNGPEFTPICPALESIQDQAIQDEVDFFREAAGGPLPELLILVDY